MAETVDPLNPLEEFETSDHSSDMVIDTSSSSADSSLSIVENTVEEKNKVTGEPPVIIPGDQPLLQKAKGWLLALIMESSALTGSFYILTPCLPLLFFAPGQFRRIIDRLVGFWIAMPGALIEYMWGSQVSVVGHKIEHADPGLIIMNHRTRLDWLFFWTALYKMDPWLLISEKISLKGILRYVPGAGWAMQCQAFLFLDRTFNSDKTKLERMIDYYSNSGFNYQLLLFPEGTDKCPLATARSEKHAREKGLTNYDYLLHTRTTGFVHIVQRMRKNGYIKWLYDVTVAYDDCIVQSEVSLITHGIAPKSIHYQVEKLPIESLPESDEELATWLTKRWEEKEEKLKRFYNREDRENTTFNIPEGGANFEMTPLLSRARIGVIATWVVVTFMWIYFMFAVKEVLVLGVCAVVFFVGCQKVYGGVEWLAIERMEEMREKKE